MLHNPCIHVYGILKKKFKVVILSHVQDIFYVVFNSFFFRSSDLVKTAFARVFNHWENATVCLYGKTLFLLSEINHFLTQYTSRVCLPKDKEVTPSLIKFGAKYTCL